MITIRSLFIVLFLMVLYGCGENVPAPVAASPSVEDSPPAEGPIPAEDPPVFEHSMLNGTWTSTCAQGGLEFQPDVWGRYVLTFDNGVLSGGFEYFSDTACEDVAIVGVDNISADYTVGVSVEIGGLNAYEIDIVGIVNFVEVVWLDIIYIDGDTFQWGDRPIWTVVRPVDFDRQFLFRRN